MKKLILMVVALVLFAGSAFALPNAASTDDDVTVTVTATVPQYIHLYRPTDQTLNFNITNPTNDGTVWTSYLDFIYYSNCALEATLSFTPGDDIPDAWELSVEYNGNTEGPYNIETEWPAGNPADKDSASRFASSPNAQAAA